LADDKDKVVALGTPGSYNPKVLIHEMMEDVDDIDFIVIGVIRKNGIAQAGWSADMGHALQRVSFLTDILKDQCMLRATEGFKDE